MVLLEILEGLQGVKPPRKVVEDYSEAFHQCEIASVEDSALSDANPYFFGIVTGALECNAVLHLRVTVHESHDAFTAGTPHLIGQHALPKHPFKTPLELLSDPEYLDVSLEAVLHHVSLDHLAPFKGLPVYP